MKIPLSLHKVLRSIWNVSVLVLYRYYPPRLFLFFPIYKFFRRRLRLPMPLSNFLVWGVSALLHGGIFLFGRSVEVGLLFGAIFLCLGLVSTVIILFHKPTCRTVLGKIRSG